MKRNGSWWTKHADRDGFTAAAEARQVAMSNTKEGLKVNAARISD